MRHSPVVDATSTRSTSADVSLGALGLAALVAAVFPFAMLAATFPVLTGVLTIGFGGLAVAGAHANEDR